MRTSFLLILTIGGLAAGCQLVAGTGDFDFDGDASPATGGAATTGGVGGIGGAEGGAGGVGAQGGAGGEGGSMLPVECSNGMLDGDETAIDCGGTLCEPCADGEPCLAPTDCASGFCDSATSGEGGGMPGGGSAAGGMPGGGTASGGSGGAIAASVCAPCVAVDDCADGAYCDAGVCLGQRVLGEACSDDTACVSGHCADGLCCNAACDGSCVSCLGGQTGGTDGSCLPVTTGTDPAGECVMTDPSTCGASGGGCNGSFDAPGCKLWPAGTDCVTPSCSGGVVDASTCDGQGVCNQQPPMACGLYACADGGMACNTTCNSDGDCAANAYCAGGACALKKQNGDGCGSGNQCASGFCPTDDFVCCDAACDGTCESCLAGKTGGTNGVCDFIPNNTDPDNECSTLTSCNGAGSCTL